MLKHTKGNLIDLAEQGEFDIIVHGCNCLNTMGSGIAAEIRDRHPQAYEADTKYSSVVSNNVEKLGNFSFYAHPDRFIIINAYTQVNYLPRGEDHFEYDAFGVILRKLYLTGAKLRFGFPYIGMGLAGGDKDRIIAMLEDFAVKVSAKGGSVTLVEFG
jgi:O-acetyl-ADP-ribose deacetylase (regulator of RNase III)